MKITYLKLENFSMVKSGMGLDTLELDFTKGKNMITLIVGNNGTGKTGGILSNIHPYAGLGHLETRDDSDIIIPEKCPILEVPFVLGSKGDYEYTPTIDRIDNSKGYTKDNIQVISKKANSMKNSASLEELKIFCKNILRYSLNTIKKEGSEQENKESLG